ncbi:hypothetical protein BDV95DRAFT_504915, partial [Massariosphaeria phaeospora]
VRWRACFGDIDKNQVLEATDSESDYNLGALSYVKLWEWVDNTTRDLLPRRVKVRSVLAIVYPTKQHKKDRLVKTLPASDTLMALAKSVFEETSHKTHIDFDLILMDEPAAQTQLPATAHSSARVRNTATQIQEDGLARVIVAEQAGGGVALGIRDHWACRDAHCDNFPLTCWVRRREGQPDRFENHYAVNGHIIAMWAREVAQELSTIQEPSDNVRVAILQDRDRAVANKANKRKHGGPQEFEDIARLERQLLSAQVQQITAQSQPGHQNTPQVGTGAGVAAYGVNPNVPTSQILPAAWAPIKHRVHWEIVEHTKNFFN